MKKRGKNKIKRRMLSGVMAAAVVLSAVDVSGWKGVVAKAADGAQTEQEKEVEIREEEANEDFGGFGDLFENDDETTGYENGFAVDTDGNTVYHPAVLTTDKYDVDGDGSYDEVYEIGNAGQLYWFADKVNNENDTYGSVNAVLTADIVVNENVLKSDGTLNDGTFKEWTPIGVDYTDDLNKRHEYSYTGAFDGQNHTISGLYCKKNSAWNIGLFGFIGSGGKIANVGVLDSYFSETGSVGGVCGINTGGIIINCYNTGTVNGQYDIGGVCGHSGGGTIINCYNTGVVNGYEDVGGVVGRAFLYNDNIGSTITNCGNTGTVSGTEDVGGVCGMNGIGKFENCNNTGTVSGSQYVGGVSGFNGSLLTNCNSTGTVSGSQYIGGVSGINNGGTITNCYYDSTIYTGNAIGTDIETTTTNVEGKTTEQYKTGEVAYLLQLDQSEAVWGQTIGTDTYPTLGGAKVYKNATYNGCEGKPGDVVSYEYSNTEKNTYGEHPDADNDGKCDACDAVIDGIGAKLAGYSLSLAGNIGVNFYMELSDDIVSDESAYMNFTLPDGTTSKVYVSGTHEDGTTATTDTTVKDDTTYYVFTCEVTAKEMTADIQAQMIGNNGEKKGKVYTYTVKEYADYILSHMSADEGDVSKATIQLVKGMLNYGGAAQKYFGYKTDKLASDGLELTETVFDDTVIMNNITNDANKASVTYYNTQDKITFKSAYLSLNSTTDLCVYVQLAEDVTVNENTFGIWCNTDQISKDQYEVTKVNEENCYKITLHGMKASQLKEKYIFYVELSDTETAELKYGATSYAYTVMSSECDNINNIESLREVVKALYAYGSCAEVYEYYKNERR